MILTPELLAWKIRLHAIGESEASIKKGDIMCQRVFPFQTRRAKWERDGRVSIGRQLFITTTLDDAIR